MGGRYVWSLVRFGVVGWFMWGDVELKNRIRGGWWCAHG